MRHALNLCPLSERKQLGVLRIVRDLKIQKQLVNSLQRELKTMMCSCFMTDKGLLLFYDECQRPGDWARLYQVLFLRQNKNMLTWATFGKMIFEIITMHSPLSDRLGCEINKEIKTYLH